MITSLNNKIRTVVFKRIIPTALTVMIIVFISFSRGNSATAQGIEGLGEFKVGMTFDDFQTWLKDRNVMIEEVRDNMEAFEIKRSGKLVVYTPLRNDAKPYSSPTDVNYVPGYKSIVLSTYAAGDIRIDDINLLFKNDILIKIGAELSDRLKEALTAKYGDPIVDVKTKKITCTFTYTGATQEKSEYTTYSTWRDDTIRAYATVFSFYNSKCELLGAKRLDIYNKSEYSNYFDLNWSAEKEYEDQLKNKKKEELKKTLDKL